MHKQIIISMKNLTKINELLSQGWTFSHNVGDKNAYALLTKYRNGNEFVGLAMPQPPINSGDL